MDIYLNNSHIQPRLLGKLLPDMSRWFRGGRERCFQSLQLLGFDGGPRSTSFTTEVLVVIFVITRFFVGKISYFRVL